MSNCEFIINKQKPQIDKTIRRQDHYFSTRLPYANKKTRETYFSMVNTTDNSTQDMINKLQRLKGKTEVKFYQKIGSYYVEMEIKRQGGTLQFEEDPSSKNVQGIGKIYHEVSFLMTFLQTKRQVKKINIRFYDLFYTVTKNRDDKEFVNNKYEGKKMITIT